MNKKIIGTWVIVGLASIWGQVSWAINVRCTEFMPQNSGQAITFTGSIESNDPSRLFGGLNFTNLYTENAIKSQITDHASNYVETFSADNGLLAIASYRKSQTEIVVSTFFMSKNLGAQGAFIRNFKVNPYADAQSGNSAGLAPSDSARVINQKLRNSFFADRYAHNGLDFTCMNW